ncbi:Protein kinase C zeta type [Collichthys lucidus]|uniref:Protein kinase C zeta type n=1 Tax=Collichthys lucidus TaxID=240159 RepID=A0A4U5UPK7_COLLU|nr:Protein kinase C zeta type [Collichthys lucidus]
MDLDSEFVKIKAHYCRDMLITDLAATVTFVELCEEVRTMCSVAKQQPITLKWIDDEVFPSIPEKPGMPCPGEDTNFMVVLLLELTIPRVQIKVCPEADSGHTGRGIPHGGFFLVNFRMRIQGVNRSQAILTVLTIEIMERRKVQK